MGRAPCCDANVKRGPWSPQEDDTLINYLQKHGSAGNWITLPRKAGLKRCGKSCRLRWLNYLRPDIKHGAFTEEEDQIILSLYENMGSRWSFIASQLPGRTDNDVKNYWNTKLKKKMLGKANKNLNSNMEYSSKIISNPVEESLVSIPESADDQSIYTIINPQLPPLMEMGFQQNYYSGIPHQTLSLDQTNQLLPFSSSSSSIELANFSTYGYDSNCNTTTASTISGLSSPSSQETLSNHSAAAGNNGGSLLLEEDGFLLPEDIALLDQFHGYYGLISNFGNFP